MSKTKEIALEKYSINGEILRQELTTYKRINGNLIKEKIERVFFKDEEYSDSFTSTPLITVST